MSGQVVHFEIPMDDAERAQSFYREAFGWSIMPMPEMSYTIVGTTPSENGMPTSPGAINGGMFTRQEPRNSPILVIAVDSIDEALPNIESLGGKVSLPKMQVGDMGWAAYFIDTEGNLLGLWENATPA